VKKNDRDPIEPALPATVRFVTFLGALIVIVWLLMFWLLVNRW